jgi:hypothetical protein
MSYHKAEGVPGGFAEHRVVKSDLNIGILGNELNALVKAPKDASSDTFESFVNWVLFVSNLFILIDYVLENNSDHLNYCDKE